MRAHARCLEGGGKKEGKGSSCAFLCTHPYSQSTPTTTPIQTYKHASCAFESKPQTVASFLKELDAAFTQQVLTVGGMVAVLGGQVDITGCSFVRFRPLGNPSFFAVSIGRDVLMIAGTMTVTGVFYSSVQLFQNKMAAGGIFAVMGGSLIITGLAINSITGLGAQWGTGLQAYVGTH